MWLRGHLLRFNHMVGSTTKSVYPFARPTHSHSDLTCHFSIVLASNNQ